MPDTITRTTDDPIARARATAPQIAAAADQIESEGRIPQHLLQSLHHARLYRALLPKTLGGDESPPATFVRMIEIIATADASTAWCIAQNSGCSMVSAYMNPETAQTIWGNDPQAALAWGFGPQGKAQAVEGGYILTGTWEFASGGHQATWLGGHSHILEKDGTPRTTPAGTPTERTMLFPASAVTWTPDWQVLGLRGTGSDTYSVTNLFIPEAHTVARDNPAERQHPGTLYRFTTTTLYAASFAGIALGIARATLDAFKILSQQKTPSSTTRLLRDSPVTQTQVALAEARLGAARAYLLTTLESTQTELEQSGALTLDQRMQIRLASTFATHEARAVTTTAYNEAGSTAIFQKHPFERRFRDINTISQQVQARATHFESVGAHLLGLTTSLRHV